MNDKQVTNARDFEVSCDKDGLTWIPLHLMFEENCKSGDVVVHVLPTGFLEARIPETDVTHFYGPDEWRHANT